MLLRIQSPAAAASRTDDLVDLLLECHGRIRYFTSLALQVAAGEGARPSEISNAAERLIRYFTVALPLHSADEDESLAPRLAVIGMPAALAGAVQSMTAQHVEIHREIDRLVSLAQVLVDRPELHADVSGPLEQTARRLEELFAAHLSAEEDLIFPFVRANLPSAQREAIITELRARRRPEDSGLKAQGSGGLRVFVKYESRAVGPGPDKAVSREP